MDTQDDDLLTPLRRQRAAEIERLERESARYQPAAERRRTSLFARLFRPGHSPWTVPATRRPGRRITVTAEIGRLDL